MRKLFFSSSIIFVLFLFIYSIAEARAWWGWGSSWWWGVVWWVIVLIIYAIREIRRKKMIKKAKNDLEKALQWDSSWDIKMLESVVENTFLKYQNAWMEKNLKIVENLLTKEYYNKANSILERKLNWKKNILKNVSINKLTLMSVRDSIWKDWDMFAMEIKASMIDYTIDEKTWDFIESTMGKEQNESINNYKDRSMNITSSFTEYYIFIRCNWNWLLNNIKDEFSIVSDVINLSEKELNRILKQEEESDKVNEDVFYN